MKQAPVLPGPLPSRSPNGMENTASLPSSQGCLRMTYEWRWRTMRLSFRANGKLGARRLKERCGGVNGSLDSSTDEFRCRKEQIRNRQRQSFTTGYSKITIPAPDRQAKRRQIQIEADSKPSPDQTKQA